MHFVIEHPSKRKTLEHRKKVQQLAAQSAWATKIVGRVTDDRGLLAWAIEPQKYVDRSKRHFEHGKNNAIAVGPAQIFPKTSTISARIEQILADFSNANHLRYETLKDAFQQYLVHIAPIIDRVHHLSESTNNECSGSITETMILEAENSQLILCCVLCISLMFGSRLTEKDEELMLVTLELRKYILSQLRGKLAFEQHNFETVFAIAHMTMIDAGLGLSEVAPHYHARALLMLTFEACKQNRLGDKYSQFLHLVTQKAALVAGLRFTSTKCSQRLQVDSKGRKTVSFNDIVWKIDVRGVPRAFIELALDGKICRQVLEEIITFANWAKPIQAVTGHLGQLGPISPVVDTSHGDVRPKLYPWRPSEAPAYMSNFERLILLALIVISDAACDIKHWSLWKYGLQSWRPLLDNIQVTHPRMFKCFIWGAGTVIAHTDERLLNRQDRESLLSRLEDKIGTARLPKRLFQDSVRKFYWIEGQDQSWSHM